jgi:Family of unknown function (DUF5329)
MKIILLTFIMISASIYAADNSSDEINHLLNYVRETKCDFIRNEIHYKSDKTVSHIKKKYAYFKDKIKTAEEFIELSATKSTVSNKLYLIECNGQPQQTSKQWLLDELVRYRASNT